MASWVCRRRSTVDAEGMALALSKINTFQQYVIPIRRQQLYLYCCCFFYRGDTEQSLLFTRFMMSSTLLSRKRLNHTLTNSYFISKRRFMSITFWKAYTRLHMLTICIIYIITHIHSFHRNTF